jgi:hypothetical protein
VFDTRRRSAAVDTKDRPSVHAIPDPAEPACAGIVAGAPCGWPWLGTQAQAIGETNAGQGQPSVMGLTAIIAARNRENDPFPPYCLSRYFLTTTSCLPGIDAPETREHFGRDSRQAAFPRPNSRSRFLGRRGRLHRYSFRSRSLLGLFLFLALRVVAFSHCRGLDSRVWVPKETHSNPWHEVSVSLFPDPCKRTPWARGMPPLRGYQDENAVSAGSLTPRESCDFAMTSRLLTCRIQ